MAYFGHLDKLPVLESLKVDEASSVIITVNDMHKKRLICEAVLKFHSAANILLKIESVDEKIQLKDLNIVEHTFNINDLIEEKTDLMSSYISNEPFLLKQKGYENQEKNREMAGGREFPPVCRETDAGRDYGSAGEPYA